MKITIEAEGSSYSMEVENFLDVGQTLNCVLNLLSVFGYSEKEITGAVAELVTVETHIMTDDTLHAIAGDWKDREITDREAVEAFIQTLEL